MRDLRNPGRTGERRIRRGEITKDWIQPEIKLGVGTWRRSRKAPHNVTRHVVDGSDIAAGSETAGCSGRSNKDIVRRVWRRGAGIPFIGFEADVRPAGVSIGRDGIHPKCQKVIEGQCPRVDLHEEIHEQSVAGERRRQLAISRVVVVVCYLKGARSVEIDGGINHVGHVGGSCQDPDQPDPPFCELISPSG